MAVGGSGFTVFKKLKANVILGAAGNHIPPTTGNVYFVCSTGGSSAHAGTDPDFPLATIDQAINKCTANQGDQIWVMENHAETIASATSLVPDVAGVSIFGLGEGRNRPTLTFSATASKIAVSGADVRISNLVFVAGISAVVVGVDVNADDFAMDNCEYNWSTTGYDFVIMVDIDAYDRSTIEYCRFIAEDAAGSNEAIRLDDAQHVTIRRCHLHGDYTNGAIYSASGDAAGVGLLIEDCTGYNSDSTLGAGIRLACAFTGTLARNHFGTAYAVAEDATFDPGSCACIENYVSGPVDKAAVLVPYGPAVGSWRIARKLRAAFNGTSDGKGTATDTVGLFNVVGVVEGFVFGVIATTCTSTTANYGQLFVGVVGNTLAFMGRKNATALVAAHVWMATGISTSVGIPAAHPRLIYGSTGKRIIESVGATAVTGGGIHYHMYWRPLEPAAHVVAL